MQRQISKIVFLGVERVHVMLYSCSPWYFRFSMGL